MKPADKLLQLDGQGAVVTGGAKGIGFAIAYWLAEAGANVLIADMDDQAARKSADELKNKGFSAEAIKTDVSSDADVKTMINRCVDSFGSIDILVNNAGIYPSKPISEMSKEEFEKVLSVNLESVFLTTKHSSEVMKKSGKSGNIINVTSVDALHPSMVGLAHYDASKHGMWGFTKNSALELAPYNIRVNAIAPGGIATPGVAAMGQGASAEQMKAATKVFLAKIPMGRIGEADEIGKVALFLASDMSSYMTGSQIVVDGGVLLS